MFPAGSRGGESDVIAEHAYFKPFKPQAGEKPLVISEFGGYAHQIQRHVFNPSDEYGYRKYNKREDYVQGLVELYEQEIIPAVKEGLCGAVYTQLSDVEDETNGLLTYDRKMCKVDQKAMLTVAQKLREAQEES